MSYNNNFQITHWNVNGPSSKTEQLASFFDESRPSVVTLNEIKLALVSANRLFRFKNYNSIFKCINKRGGRVALLTWYFRFQVKLFQICSFLKI